MSGRLTHIGWDCGLFAEVVDPLLAVELGIHPPPAKTTTAMCGKRVAAARIDNQAATCPACRAEVTGFARASLELLAAYPELRCHTGDPGALVDGLLEDLARFGEPTPWPRTGTWAKPCWAAAPRTSPATAATRSCSSRAVGAARDRQSHQPRPPTTQQPKKEGCRPATTPLSAVPLSKGVPAMLDTTLWQVDMGDGTWAVSCLACQQPLFRGAKAEADRVFDSHTCEPIVPLTAPIGG